MGVDVTSQPPLAEHGGPQGCGLGGKEATADACEFGASGETGGGVGLGGLSLLLRWQQPGEVPRAAVRLRLAPHPHDGAGAVALASSLLTTLPPAVLPGLCGPHSPEDCPGLLSAPGGPV